MSHNAQPVALEFHVACSCGWESVSTSAIERLEAFMQDHVDFWHASQKTAQDAEAVCPQCGNVYLSRECFTAHPEVIDSNLFPALADGSTLRLQARMAAQVIYGVDGMTAEQFKNACADEASGVWQPEIERLKALLHDIAVAVGHGVPDTEEDWQSLPAEIDGIWKLGLAEVRRLGAENHRLREDYKDALRTVATVVRAVGGEVRIPHKLLISVNGPVERIDGLDEVVLRA